MYYVLLGSIAVYLSCLLLSTDPHTCLSNIYDVFYLIGKITEYTDSLIRGKAFSHCERCLWIGLG